MTFKKHIINFLTVWQNHWREVAAMVYLIICLTDFVIMPSLYASSTPHIDQMVLYAKQFEPNQQVQALTVLHTTGQYTPITYGGSGILHLSFLTILGVAAWTRGQENIAQMASNTGINPPPTTPAPTPQPIPPPSQPNITPP